MGVRGRRAIPVPPSPKTQHLSPITWAQPKDLDVHATGVVDQWWRRGWLGEAGCTDQLVAEGQDARTLDRVRRVVNLAALKAAMVPDVQVVALDQKVLQGAGRRGAEVLARLVTDLEARTAAEEPPSP